MSDKTNLTFQINKPCREQLSNMDIVDNGYFCHICEKEVVDFREKAPEEITAYLQNQPEKVCGLFWVHQVQSPVILSRSHAGFSRLKAAALALVAITGASACMGKVSDPRESSRADTFSDPLTLKPAGELSPRTVRGQLWQVCSDTTIYPSVNLGLRHSDLVIHVDEKGWFSFEVPRNFKHQTLELEMHRRIIRTIDRSELPLDNCQVYFPLTALGDVNCTPARK